MINRPAHTFHIPVLGLSFSIDTPVKVARYGISSVVSIIDDELIEDMRRYHSEQNNLEFTPISEKEPDYRARRITAYLNLLQELVDMQVAQLRAMEFTPGTDLWKYFELLPETSADKQLFHQMLHETNSEQQAAMKQQLRALIKPGAVDVNIMAKVDNPRYDKAGNQLPDEFSDALSSLRGFAQSNLSSSLVISAGYNPRLFSSAEQFDDFFPDENGTLRKTIILKVSDYRSALVQGKILAKKGIWVSEYRIESGLNCGGHAFATEGVLMGPILEEFKQKRSELHAELLSLCNSKLQEKGKHCFTAPPQQRISAQGGIGTAEENNFLLEYYGLDGTGWGSPFLLVPEATNLDETTLHDLAAAQKEDFYLSNSSPLGVPFNNFRRTSSEAQRKMRIQKGRPGSPCYKNYLRSNTEFTDKIICTSSRQYQNYKIKQLESMNLPADEFEKQVNALQEKDCLCEGLTASVRVKNSMKLSHNMSAVAVCPGPNLAYFSGVFSLKEMVHHIYGQLQLTNKLERPHMFVNELQLYIDYLKTQIQESKAAVEEKQKKCFSKFKANLHSGIEYYSKLLPTLPHNAFNMVQLSALKLQLAGIE